MSDGLSHNHPFTDQHLHPLFSLQNTVNICSLIMSIIFYNIQLNHYVFNNFLAKL
jgi:hypothetical protein